MAVIDDINAEIKNEDVQLTTQQTLITKIGTDIADLKAAAQSGAVTPQQLQDALTALQSHVAALTTSNQQLTDADAAANK